MDVEAAGAVVSVPGAARSGVRAEFVGDFFSAFWFSGDFVIAGDVIIEISVPSHFSFFNAVQMGSWGIISSKNCILLYYSYV